MTVRLTIFNVVIHQADCSCWNDFNKTCQCLIHFCYLMYYWIDPKCRYQVNYFVQVWCYICQIDILYDLNLLKNHSIRDFIVWFNKSELAFWSCDKWFVFWYFQRVLSTSKVYFFLFRCFKLLLYHYYHKWAEAIVIISYWA